MKADLSEVDILIQAGGKGVRLRPYTYVLPKPLLPIHGTPILQRILDSVISDGATQCYVSVGYLGDYIKLFFGDSYRSCAIQYVQETTPLGTIGAARKASSGKNPLLVINGDLLFDCSVRPLVETHCTRNAAITIATRHHHVCVPYGVVETNQNSALISINEKPELHFKVCFGINVLSPQAIDLIPEETKYDMPTLAEDLLNRGLAVQYFELNGNCSDVGTVHDYHDYLYRNENCIDGQL